MLSNEFEAFFTALHGRTPFPWQARLSEQVCKDNFWPDALNLPTSTGKTAALDVALFHLLVEAARHTAPLSAPRRIYYVVDRRLVVDEAFERSKRIATRLNDALHEESILGKAARLLLQLSGRQINELSDKEPLLPVLRLRGGMPLERSFITNPLLPAIVVTTVDQIGSRLLFRGYGVSANMRPIHAALTAVDSLILLDEAHLSKPFVQTLAAIEHYRSEKWHEVGFELPHGVIQMTATPDKEQSCFVLSDKDYQHPLLAQRLRSSKYAELVEIKDETSLAKEIEKKAVEMMLALQNAVDHPVLGIVCNRVALARAVFELLQTQIELADCVLLTGRVRAFDRDQILQDYLERIKAGRSDAANSRPIFVVATQTIEVGADLDLDGLISEAASLDALRQRFGRLNRLGERPYCLAALFYSGKSNKDDPVYGKALSATWKWLNDHSEKIKKTKSIRFNFGIQSLDELIVNTQPDLSTLNQKTSDAPVLLPSHLDTLVQTSPSPRLEPDTALLLHGSKSRADDVQVVWRADISKWVQKSDLAILQYLPPLQHEVLAIPLPALKAFLAADNSFDTDDLEGVIDTTEFASKNNNGKPGIVWKGSEGGEVARVSQLRPGMVVVLPASYSGADSFGWHPQGSKPVPDVAEENCLQRRGKACLRIHTSLIANWFTADASIELIESIKDLIGTWQQRITEDAEPAGSVFDEVLQYALHCEGLKPAIREIIQILLTVRRSEIPYSQQNWSNGVLLVTKQNVTETLADDDDSTSHSREITLENHCQGVKQFAGDFARQLGLPDELIEILEHAALFHDLGKADPRFQAMLQGGIQLNSALLAKSAINAVDRATRSKAQKLSQYPVGQRHEAYSVAILTNYPNLTAHLSDPELATYLAGVHHGRGRPFMPVVTDEGIDIDFSFLDQNLQCQGAHGLETIDSGWVDLFWRMVRRYGYWGLALLETLVRLADQQRSIWETKNG